ncbi:MAG: DUF5330 domain-containing protein [Pseudomonadota bacterium]
MGFLLKAAFWLAVVVLLLPTPDGREVVSHSGEPVNGTEAIGVARDLIADMSGFCTRNAEACDTGIAAAQAFGVKAQHGAMLLYDYIDQFTGEGGRAVPLSSNGSTPSVQPSSGILPSAGNGDATQQNTAVRAQGGALQVQNVNTIRVPVTATTATTASRPIAGTATAPVAVQTDHQTSSWQADAAGQLGATAWREPLSRSELFEPAPTGPARDTIGQLIRQVQ